jgi:Amt family ammonium transporter
MPAIASGPGLRAARIVIRAALGLALLPVPAALASPLKVDAGDTAWMMTATALVLVISIPGLALFYGGLVRTKNTLSMLTQVFTIVAAVAILWIVVGYSLTFTSGPAGGLIGGLGKTFLRGITADSVVATRTPGFGIPEYTFICFQMMFACITPAILVGAFAERLRFSSVLIVTLLWFLVVYVPIAHMTWHGPAPDAVAAAAKAFAEATGAEARRLALETMAQLQREAGAFYGWGFLDFAGGSVIHVNAGIAGLVGAVMIGRRIGYGRQSMAPHSVTLTMLGACLMWVGWIGFNGGSSLRADKIAALAVANTIVAAAAGALAWTLAEVFARGRPSLVGLLSGMLAGLVAVTPCAGYVAPMGSVVIAMVAALLCFWFCTEVKARFNYDDSLDVFGLHCIAGLAGTLLVAVFASPQLGGTIGPDLGFHAGLVRGGEYSITAQLWIQIKAVMATMAWSAYVSALLFWLIDITLGLRLPEQIEERGLDIVDHGERAYNY